MKDADRFWTWLEEHLRGRGRVVDLRARFRSDVATTVPFTIVLREGEPVARLSAAAKALFGTLDPATATQVYTVHDVHSFLAEEIVLRGAARAGLTWHYARPPVIEFDYEMDTRCVTREILI